MAQRFDDLLSPRKRKRGSSKSATLLLFLDTPAAIILLGKSKTGFTGLTTTRTRWKWLVTNVIYLPKHPLDRGLKKGCPYHCDTGNFSGPKTQPFLHSRSKFQ